MDQLMTCWMDEYINGWQTRYMDNSIDGLLYRQINQIMTDWVDK